MCIRIPTVCKLPSAFTYLPLHCWCSSGSEVGVAVVVILILFACTSIVTSLPRQPPLSSPVTIRASPRLWRMGGTSLQRRPTHVRCRGLRTHEVAAWRRGACLTGTEMGPALLWRSPRHAAPRWQRTAAWTMACAMRTLDPHRLGYSCWWLTADASLPHPQSAATVRSLVRTGQCRH